MNSISRRASPAFAITRWSIVTQAVTSAPLSPRDALVELCMGYWYPVYAYVRRSGHAPAIAHDIAHAFLEHLLHGFRSSAHAMPETHFRQFLLERLHAFLGSDWREAHDEKTLELTLPQGDVEARYERECRSTASPELAFQRGFALEVLARAAQRLSSEAHQAGHATMYRTLAPFLVRDPVAGQYEELASALHTRVLTVVVALKRLRQRLRELVGEELAETVTSTGELDAERDALYAVLLDTGAAR